MALEIFYSALHWAKKAERSATSAANSSQIARTAAAQASQASGKIIQLGFDGTIEDGKLVFKHAPGGVEVPYELLDDYEYEVDMLYNSTEELSSDLPMVIKNGANTITFVSALHRSADEPATIGDMAPVMRESNGNFRWLFKAAYKITPAGKKVFLLYPVVASEEAINSKITNCITEIPQDIKLELNNGTLTLKAGSKAYIPNGSGRFDEYTVSSDRIVDNAQLNGTHQWMLALTNNGSAIFPRGLTNCVSGAGATTSGGFAYDTTTNIISWYSASGVKQSGNCSLPVCIFSTTDGVPTSIDQVFNGFGYIGSTVFALPGVKGLIPNGRNADGSLKNIEFTVGKVFTRTLSANNYDTNMFLWFNASLYFHWTSIYVQQETPPAISANNQVWYQPSTNKMYRSLSSTNEWQEWTNFLYLGNLKATLRQITSFTPKLPFRAVDYNEVKSLGATITYWE